MKWGYDCDGVLCEAPVLPPTPWRYMNKQQRDWYREMLEDHYAKAKRLHTPKQKAFAVITARKATVENAALTRQWVSRNLPGKRVQLFMLTESRTLEAVVQFKAKTIEALDLTDYVEDNKKVVRKLRRLLPRVRVWLFENGALSLD